MLMGKDRNLKGIGEIFHGDRNQQNNGKQNHSNDLRASIASGFSSFSLGKLVLG